ncbi:MAG: hypothetical protein IKG21_01300 [Atopobiaceae bacterium]|nr:hypothetical protein [Atopobiaceae bacterium]
MKHGIVALLVACLLLSGCGAPAAEEGQSPEIVAKKTELSKLPALASFTAKTAENKDFSSKDLEGKSCTVVVVWSGQDEDVNKYLGDLRAWADLLPKDIQVITICTDYEDDGKYVLNEANYNGTTLVSGDEDYLEFVGAIEKTPTAVAIDTDGTLLAEPLEGVPDDLQTAYGKLLNQALAQKGIAIG